jgi:hypothetical protein
MRNVLFPDRGKFVATRLATAHWPAVPQPSVVPIDIHPQSLLKGCHTSQPGPREALGIPVLQPKCNHAPHDQISPYVRTDFKERTLS